MRHGPANILQNPPIRPLYANLLEPKRGLMLAHAGDTVPRLKQTVSGNSLEGERDGRNSACSQLCSPGSEGHGFLEPRAVVSRTAGSTDRVAPGIVALVEGFFRAERRRR